MDKLVATRAEAYIWHPKDLVDIGLILSPRYGQQPPTPACLREDHTVLGGGLVAKEVPGA